jgi:hypothetical protein
MATRKGVAKVVAKVTRKPARKIGSRIRLGIILWILTKITGKNFVGSSESIWENSWSIVTDDTEEDVFPGSMRKSYGKSVGWACEVYGRQWKEGWLLDFHYKVLRSLGGKHTRENMQCLCLRCHFWLHRLLEFFRIGGNSSTLIRSRLRETHGGRRS